jgi:RNA polymerase sigma-70 factor (ECF subfamily)
MGGDVDRAEEAVQDAYAVALDRWPRDGVPSTPAAWILTTAKRRAIDRLRREAALRDRQALLAHELEEAVRELPGEDDEMIPDERLGLVFACCHPALAPEAQVPLTLRLVGGLTVPEIARALLLPEPTVAQRLVRAKKKVRLSGIPLAEPEPDALPGRLGAVLAVLYLVFNEGYAATAGDALVRDDLAAEAIRLARIVHELLPAEPEPAGLLALMLLHQARRRRAHAPPPARPVRAAGGDRRGPRPGAAAGGHRLARDRAAVPRAGARAAEPGRGAQPRRRGLDGGRADGRPRTGRRAGRARRARRLPPAPRRARRPAAPPGPQQRRGRGLRARAGARDERAGAALPRRAAGGVPRRVAPRVSARAPVGSIS